jgi:hypothetical protein
MYHTVFPVSKEVMFKFDLAGMRSGANQLIRPTSTQLQWVSPIPGFLAYQRQDKHIELY